ncbi:hypothetical protein PR048_004027 [Dryococelus australis]|uniref:Uncharacterized protein n=1 Tax=Dryococelus australis TaxID=614101 RepID=A0ABQ9I4B7_9NEOP|nr:hypothetical protein PR048_004027 [Dryococelus australis]
MRAPTEKTCVSCTHEQMEGRIEVPISEDSSNVQLISEDSEVISMTITISDVRAVVNDVVETECHKLVIIVPCVEHSEEPEPRHSEENSAVSPKRSIEVFLCEDTLLCGSTEGDRDKICQWKKESRSEEGIETATEVTMLREAEGVKQTGTEGKNIKVKPCEERSKREFAARIQPRRKPVIDPLCVLCLLTLTEIYIYFLILELKHIVRKEMLCTGVKNKKHMIYSYIKLSGETYTECRDFFLNTLNIGEDAYK